MEVRIEVLEPGYSARDALLAEECTSRSYEWTKVGCNEYSTGRIHYKGIFWRHLQQIKSYVCCDRRFRLGRKDPRKIDTMATQKR